MSAGGKAGIEMRGFALETIIFRKSRRKVELAMRVEVNPELWRGRSHVEDVS